MKIASLNSIIMILTALACTSCSMLTDKTTESYTFRELSLPVEARSQQHHLAQTADGKLIVSWVEIDGQVRTVRFAVYDQGVWSSVRTVTRIKGRLGDPPVVLGLSDGSLAAAWMPYVSGAKSKYAADIYLAISKDGGSTWSTPFKPYGESARIYDAQMSLTALPDARLAVVWTDMRYASEDEEHKSQNRFQLMAAIIDNNGRVGAEMTLDDDVCSCCRAYTDAEGEDLITTYRDHTADEIRDIAAVRWRPDGPRHSEIVHHDQWHIEGCPSNGPSVDSLGRKKAVAWFSAADGNGRVKAAFLQGNDQSFAQPIEIDTGASGYVNVSLLNDNEALVAWRGRTGPEDELRVAKISAGGAVSKQTVVYRGNFPKWPSKYLGLVKVDNEAFVAWTDPHLKRVRLAAVLLD